MKVHILQHVAFEGIGSIRSWLKAKNTTVGYTHFHDRWHLPSLEGLDLIIVMGGPMSVNDEATLSWLVQEKAFIRDAIHQGVPVLGICLGAQLIANVLGARVYPGSEREIGWFDIESDASTQDVFHFPKTATVFHWHGETFDLPGGATRLARSSACDNQAFQFGHNVIGLQFHLEVTPACVEEMITYGRHELVPGTYVQSEADMRTAPPVTYERINPLMAGVLTFLTR